MKKTNAGKEEQLKTCWSTMLKYVGNIAKVSLPALRPAARRRSTAPYSSCLQPVPALSCPVCFWVNFLAQSLQVRRLLSNLTWGLAAPGQGLGSQKDNATLMCAWRMYWIIRHDWQHCRRWAACVCNVICLTDTCMSCCPGPKGRQVQEDPAKQRSFPDAGGEHERSPEVPGADRLPEGG